jgi:hypothetical protein
MKNVHIFLFALFFASSAADCSDNTSQEYLSFLRLNANLIRSIERFFDYISRNNALSRKIIDPTLYNADSPYNYEKIYQQLRIRILHHIDNLFSFLQNKEPLPVYPQDPDLATGKRLQTLTIEDLQQLSPVKLKKMLSLCQKLQKKHLKEFLQQEQSKIILNLFTPARGIFLVKNNRYNNNNFGLSAQIQDAIIISNNQLTEFIFSQHSNVFKDNPEAFAEIITALNQLRIEEHISVLKFFRENACCFTPEQRCILKMKHCHAVALAEKYVQQRLLNKQQKQSQLFKKNLAQVGKIILIGAVGITLSTALLKNRWTVSWKLSSGFATISNMLTTRFRTIAFEAV